MSSKKKTLDDLFLHGLKDIHFAQKHIGKAMSRLAKATGTKVLEQAFEAHRETMHGQVERLDQVFALIEKKPHGTDCDVTLGLVAETKEVIAAFEDSDVIDLALLAAAGAMDHYVVARTTALKAWASQLGHNQAATLLEQTLDEERTAIETWTALGLSSAAEAETPQDPAGSEPARPALTLKGAALVGLQ